MIHTVTGKGCFVAPFTSEQIRQKRNEMILDQLTQDITFYKSYGVTREELMELMDKVY